MPPRVRLAAPERRAVILAAAQEVFLTQGGAAARTRQIAQSAGITEAVLYRHFASKDELFDVAVLTPLAASVATLCTDLRRLADEAAARDDVTNAELLLVELLTGLQPIVPFLGAVAFADPSTGSSAFHRLFMQPVGDAVAEVAAAYGWPQTWQVPSGGLASVVVGMTLGHVMDAQFRGKRLAVRKVAGQLSATLITGLAAP